MWLLNTKTYELREFLGDKIPEYVILSHRWAGEEVTFKDFRKGRNTNSAGYRKVIDFCSFARSRVREWVWIDTCCIDKRSSSELSEAVNSMYQYYERARECFAYLSDVPPMSHERDVVVRRLCGSEWFKRGWTLQELLAPAHVVFLTKQWEIIGSKLEFASEIAQVTGIPGRILTGMDPIHTDNGSYSLTSVAQKMSWASTRVSTRAEDTAYSLLGLFGVHMPLLYGEGAEKAFVRLQLQIIADYDDESIFAWSAPSRAPTILPTSRRGMLAPSLAAFSHAGSIFKLPYSNQGYTHRPHYAMTNRGLLYQGPAQQVLKDRTGMDMAGFYIIYLNCFDHACNRWPVVVCKPFSLGEGYLRYHSEWTPEQVEAEFPELNRQAVELPNVYIT